MNDQAEIGQLFSFTNFKQLNTEEKVLVWKWRNHDSIRRWMYNSAHFSFENHLKFLGNLNSNHIIYFLVQRKDIPLGVFSIKDIGDHTADLGYYISPDHHRKKLSVEFLYHVLRYAFETLNFRRVIGYVLVNNKAANSLYEVFGFERRIEERRENGEIREYFFSELQAKTWFEELKTNKAILQRFENNDTK